jgi:PAS domain S-box-containing protein
MRRPAGYVWKSLFMDLSSEMGRERLWIHSRLLMLTAKFDGTIIAANPAWTQILGWSVDEIIGTTFFELLHPDDLERTVAAATAMMVEGCHVPKFENRYRTKSGQYRDIDWTAVSDGQFILALGRDNSDEKIHAHALAQAEDAMRQAQKMEAIGHFTGSVAHDFNNLLTVITGSVELLRRPNLSEDRRAKFLNAIGDTAERATKLTGQLLAFARRQTLKPELFDVNKSVAEVADVVRTLTGSRIQLDLKLPNEQLLTLADRSQFDTAVINLAINARDAMNGEGRLTIATERVTRIPERRLHKAVVGDFVAVSVTDTGSGIREGDIAKIFEPFFTTKEVGHGTGLGLSQVIGFAKQSGGDIHVCSKLDLGSTFTLYLPHASGNGASDSDKLSVAAADGIGVCVLVVEDNASVGEFAASALLELGYDIVLVDSPHRALAELAKNNDRFHVVFTDVIMPGMSGIELGEEVRRLYPDLPVVLTSGYSHVLAQNSSRGFELLPKPYSVEQLSTVLRLAAVWKTANRTI